jgi:pyrroloquinoline-quinone synthase
MKSLQSEIACANAFGSWTPEAAVRFKRVATAHRLWRHPFVERCRAGQLTVAQVRVLGAQMYKFCREFPRFLAAALVACQDADAHRVIAENLWEELGEGDPQRVHAALFRRFTRALGLDDAQLSAVPAEPETTGLIDTYLGLGKRYGAPGILGALCYASEGIVAALYTHIQRGLLQAVPFDKEALMFFEVHVHVDDGHADKLESILLPMLRTQQDLKLAEQAIQTALDARCRFFDGVLRVAVRGGSRPSSRNTRR